MTTPTHEKSFPEDKYKLPLAFVFRRLHSLLGVWLVLYLCEHLLVNSQAALYFQNRGYEFIRLVNQIHEIPYLKVVEVIFLGLPFLIHGLWGIYYAYTSRNNSFSTNGKNPALPRYRRNRAFTWQRVTSWILLFGIILHVIQMRFLDYPSVFVEATGKTYVVQVKKDEQVQEVAKEMHAKIYTEEKWGETPKPGHVLIEAQNAGTAFFFVVRDTFKSPLMVLLYSILVVAAAYHAFNGLWTAFITWGITLTRRSQQKLRYCTTFLMWVVMFLGLMACWGPYWNFVWR